MRIRALLLMSAVAGFSCRSHVDPTPEPATSCTVGQRSNTPGDTVTIAVSSRVDIPISGPPVGDDVLLLHRQLYETLVTIDCNGHLQPALSSEWEAHDGGREWRFVMRSGATYWDGVPVSIVDVIDSWERNWSAIQQLVPPGEYFDVTGAISYDRLIVRLEEPDSAFPAYLARPELAVSLRTESSEEWDLGTGGYRPVAGERSDGVLTLRPRDDSIPSLRFVSVGGADARDALDAGLDVVMGREKAAVDYVRRRDDYVDYPLPWNQTFALVVRSQNIGPAAISATGLSSLRSGIARDAVRIDARPSVCNIVVADGAAGIRTSAATNELVHDATDATARAVSERLVAVTSDSNRASMIGLPDFRRVAGSDALDGVRRVRSGASSGAVVRFTHWSACEVPRSLLGVLDGLALIPLIETRSHMFSAVGQIQATIGWDGTPLFFPRRGR